MSRANKSQRGMISHHRKNTMSIDQDGCYSECFSGTQIPALNGNLDVARDENPDLPERDHRLSELDKLLFEPEERVEVLKFTPSTIRWKNKGEINAFRLHFFYPVRRSRIICIEFNHKASPMACYELPATAQFGDTVLIALEMHYSETDYSNIYERIQRKIGYSHRVLEMHHYCVYPCWLDFLGRRVSLSELI
jgi:hypothetical protein